MTRKPCDKQVEKYYIKTWLAIVKKDPNIPWHLLKEPAKASWRVWYMAEKGHHG